ncbi:hypothetical protein [Pseudomonas putida]|uniref:hypothetical protein n=1 Tax=Pseudomonas putida TaxID=303 RepID=UPI003D954118
MANRSKKVVLSVRVDPYLKAALELSAVSKNEKIVKVLETCLESGLNDREIPNPFKPRDANQERISFMIAFTAIWTESEALYKLRAGALGPGFAGEELATAAMLVLGDNYFRGDTDLFGDLNGAAKTFGFTPKTRPMVNLLRVEEEWSVVEEYVRFLANNKPLAPDYKDYKRMRTNAG